jgi:O-acetylserine/cysteine efflux transporter
MAIGASIVAYGLWYYLMNKYEVSSIVAINLMPPVVAAVSSTWLLGEEMSWEKIVGGLITLFGVAVIQIRWNRIAGPVE